MNVKELSESQIIAIFNKINEQFPQVVGTVLDDLSKDEENKRKLLQEQQNLSEDLDKINHNICSLEDNIANAKDNINNWKCMLKTWNGQRGAYIKQKKNIEAKLTAIHKEWCEKYSSTGNCSL